MVIILRFPSRNFATSRALCVTTMPNTQPCKDQHIFPNTATNFKPLVEIKSYPWIWNFNVIRIQRSLINNAHLHKFQCAAQISSLDCNAIWNSDRNPAYKSGTSSILTQTSHVSHCHQHTRTHRNATTAGQAAFYLGIRLRKQHAGENNTKLLGHVN